jgi:predicted nucleotidyltransferase
MLKAGAVRYNIVITGTFNNVTSGNHYILHVRHINRPHCGIQRFILSLATLFLLSLDGIRAGFCLLTMNDNHKIALNEALAWVSLHFKPVGIIVTGSIVRGNPDLNSDFDIFVIHEASYRQRVQKYFNGVPCEIFINNFNHVYSYFEKEFENNRPVSAHMISTGKLIMGDDHPGIKELIQSAQEFQLKTPSITGNTITRLKYAISTLFEDATDVMETDPVSGAWFLNKLVSDIIDYIFLINGTSYPRPKERIKYLQANHPYIGNLVAAYYGAENFGVRYEIAKSLIAKTTGEYGFFEWDSGQE